MMQPIDTSTSAVELTEVIGLIPSIVQAFSHGVLTALSTIFPAVFLVTRVRVLREWLAKTKADWVVPAVRALCIIGGAVVGGLIVGGVSAVFGGIAGAMPIAWVYIDQAIKEATD